eukprot:gene6673-7756_t
MPPNAAGGPPSYIFPNRGLMPPNMNMFINPHGFPPLGMMPPGMMPPGALVPPVYVGRIPDTVADDFIKGLLELCGNVVKWNRASETGGKLKGFGFCEYETPEGVLRALRLLNDLQVDDKKLMLKEDDKLKKYLDEYVKKRNIEQHKQENGNDNDDEGAAEEKESSIDNEQQSEKALKEEKIEDEEVRTKIAEMLDSSRTAIDENKRIKEKEKGEEALVMENKNFDLRLMTRDEKQKMAAKEKERELEREKERESRKRERIERDFREKERDWEARERDKERDQMEEFASDEDRLRKRLMSRDALVRRQKEREADQRDKERDIQEYKAANKNAPTGGALTAEAISKIQIGFSTKRGVRLTSTGFATTEEPEHSAKKKQTFVPLDYTEIDMNNNNNNNEENYNSNNKEKKALTKEEIQRIINTIPADKEELLKMDMDWETVDRLSLVESKMRPWIGKKLAELLGVEETILIEHITSLLAAHSDPYIIIEQLKEMIDDEAETFVLKMWRMLAFLAKTS